MATERNQPISARNARFKRVIPVSAGEVLYHGTLVFIVDGYARAARIGDPAVDLFGGVADDFYDNTNGGDGDVLAIVYIAGAFWFPVAMTPQQFDVGETFFAMDNFTVSGSPGDGPPMGTCTQIQGESIEVDIEIGRRGDGIIIPGPTDGLALFTLTWRQLSWLSWPDAMDLPFTLDN